MVQIHIYLNIDCKSIKGKDGLTFLVIWLPEFLILQELLQMPIHFLVINRQLLRAVLGWVHPGFHSADWWNRIWSEIADIIADLLQAAKPYTVFEQWENRRHRAKISFEILENAKIRFVQLIEKYNRI